MRIRIRHPSAKFGVLFSGFLVAALAFAAGDAVSQALGVVLLTLVELVVVGFCVRVFRGAREPLEPPRPWWRLTATPLWAFIVAASFALSAVQSVSALAGGGSLTLVFAALVDVVLAAAFAASGMRQRRE